MKHKLAIPIHTSFLSLLPTINNKLYLLYIHTVGLFTAPLPTYNFDAAHCLHTRTYSSSSSSSNQATSIFIQSRSSSSTIRPLLPQAAC